MEPARAGTDQLDSRFDELHAEGRAAVGYSANTLRSVRERYPAAYAGAGEAWVLEVRDDGRGVDVGAVAARGRRNFALEFMSEPAELIGGRFDVRSRPDGGTVVRLAIPTGAGTAGEERE
jgi:signal transduction histidine kinase